MMGRQVLFTTGTDEHGLKVEEAARRNEFKSTAEFCDTVAESFQECFRKFLVSHDDFGRTTEVRATSPKCLRMAKYDAELGFSSVC